MQFFCQAVAKLSFYCIRISNQVFFWDLSFFYDRLEINNLQYNMLGRWDNSLINQASDVPSTYYFFSKFLAKFFTKILSIFFITLQKENKLKGFLQRILQEIMKKNNMYLEHQTLGRRFVCPIVQVTQRIIL